MDGTPTKDLTRQGSRKLDQQSPGSGAAIGGGKAARDEVEGTSVVPAGEQLDDGQKFKTVHL